MPTAPARRPVPAVPPAGPLAAVRRWWRGDGGEADRLRSALAAARREAALLRAAAAEPDPRRLLAALHGLLASDGSAASAVLEADGGGWSVRLAAGDVAPGMCLSLLPRPAGLPDRAERLRDLPAPLARGWSVPGGTPDRPRLVLLGGPLPDGGDVLKGRRLAEVLAGSLDRALTCSDEAADAARRLAVRDAQVAAHAAAAAGGDAAGVLGDVLAALAGHCGATHAALLTAGPSVRRLAAAGPTDSAPVEVVRLAHEHRLADAPAAGPVVAFEPAELAAAGVNSLIGRAVRVAVPGAVPAALIVSRADGGPFAAHHAEVCGWAGGFLADLLPRVSATAAVRRRASRDPLTGLANRATFEDRLEDLAAAAAAGGDDVTLLMCDLDHFKAVNDTHGHQAGDAVLVAAADAFRTVLAGCRKGDRALAARFGGEELCVLLAGFGAAGADRVAERLRTAVAAIGAESGGRLPDVTVSIGLAAAPGDAGGPADLVAAADAALYAAKRGGRDRVVRAGGERRAPGGLGGVEIASRPGGPNRPGRVAGPLASA